MLRGGRLRGKLEYGLVIDGGHSCKLLFHSEARPDNQGRFRLDGLLGPAGNDGYQLNWWPDADARIDPRARSWSGEGQPYVRLRTFRPTADKTTDLGDVRAVPGGFWREGLP